MPIDINKPAGTAALNVVTTTGAGTRTDVVGVYVDGVQVSGIAGGDEVQLMGSIEVGSAGFALGSPITANGVYAAVTSPWTTTMPLAEIWTNKTVDGSGTPVVTIHYTRRY